MRPRHFDLSNLPLTVEQQVEEVDRLIMTIKKWPNRDRWELVLQALKQVALDLRARSQESHCTTVRLLQQRVHRVERSVSARGYDDEAAHLLAGEVMRRWPQIRRALELAAEDAAAEQNTPSMTDLPF